MTAKVQLRRILAPLDGSPQAESILPYLQKLAQVHQAHLQLLCVVDPLTFPGDASPAYQREKVDQARKYLRQLIPESSQEDIGMVCGLGPVVEVIRDQALREHCDLIVFASRGQGGLKRWLFGSVAESVVRRAPCPVLLARGEAHSTFGHILMPLAFDDDVRGRIRGVQPFLRPETRLTLLHCCGGKPMDVGLRSQISDLLAERPSSAFVQSESSAPKGILDWALDSDCDLLAMSTHGRSGLQHLIKGSIMEQVGRHAPCPVLVVPSTRPGEWKA